MQLTHPFAKEDPIDRQRAECLNPLVDHELDALNVAVGLALNVKDHDLASPSLDLCLPEPIPTGHGRDKQPVPIMTDFKIHATEFFYLSVCQNGLWTVRWNRVRQVVHPKIDRVLNVVRNRVGAARIGMNCGMACLRKRQRAAKRAQGCGGHATVDQVPPRQHRFGHFMNDLDMFRVLK